MEYRQLGGSGFKVPVLSLGTGTFGGGNEFFKAWGASDVADATRLVDICLEGGMNLFDSAGRVDQLDCNVLLSARIDPDFVWRDLQLTERAQVNCSAYLIGSLDCRPGQNRSSTYRTRSIDGNWLVASGR